MTTAGIPFLLPDIRAYRTRQDEEVLPVPDSLAQLEHRRAAIAQQISQLGDLRPGSISDAPGRCGKPICHCHQPGHPVHGPNLRLISRPKERSRLNFFNYYTQLTDWSNGHTIPL
jgi:hypothetical protein